MLEIGKRKVNARKFARKIAFLRALKIFTYVNLQGEFNYATVEILR